MGRKGMDSLSGGAGGHGLWRCLSPSAQPLLFPAPSHMSYCFRVVLKSFCVSEHGGTGCAGGCSCLPGVWPKWPTCLLPAQPLGLPQHQQCWWGLVGPSGNGANLSQGVNTLFASRQLPLWPLPALHTIDQGRKRLSGPCF